jgi:hypothetical protein
MHFVAESITEKQDEFELAVSSLVCNCKIGGSFFCTFMENSTGYDVAGLRFPAVAVDADIITRVFDSLPVGNLEFHRIPLGSRPLRAGYTGMLTACGRRTDR